jgi:hypothetical protein
MIEYMKELLDKFLTLLLSLFPVSPFLPAIQQLSALPYLGYINWFVPVGTFVKIGSMWTAAILAYYAWSVIARWVKLLS